MRTDQSRRKRVVAFDICNTLADIVTVLDNRFGLRPRGVYHHPKVTSATFIAYPMIYGEAKPYKLAAALVWFMSLFFEVVYITSRDESARTVTEFWLTAHHFPRKKVYYGVSNKANLAKELGVVLAFEDCPDEIRAYDMAGIKTIVPKRDYNLREQKTHFCI